MKIKNVIYFIAASTLLLGSISLGAFTKGSVVYTPTFATYINNDAETYYKDIDFTANASSLLKQLQDLNKEKRKTTVGYSSMGTSPSGQYKYTDYDPNYVQYDSNGQPYGTKISSFYTYTSATSWNREHVWPNSHGGGSGGGLSSPYIDADIHMPRPTISSENSSRGNSYYVEGMNSDKDGWDPKTAGYDENSRGEAARIILYCVVADPRLELEAANKSGSKNNKMGNIETILKWTMQYEVTQREKNRNEGAEYLQGNRNPFIDHPTLGCRIWGKTNDKTKQICAGYLDDDPIETVNVTGVSLNKNDLTLEAGKSETLTATVSPNNATNKKVTWTTDKSSVATVNNGAVTAVGEGTATIKVTTSDGGFTASCTVTVTPKPKYTISFNANGGTGNMESVSKEAGSYTLPANGFTAPENQEFAGWKVNNTGSLLQPGASITISESTTIYAQWKDITYTVTFNSDGGSPVNSQNIVKGQLATKPADPTRTGYTFLGWFLGENEYNFTTPITGDITLVAKWQKDDGGEKQIFTVSFNSNGGSQVDPQQVEEEQKVTKPADPTRDGYDFAGWYLGDTLYDFNTPVTRDFTLFAHWTEKSGGDDPVVVAKLDTSKPLLITAPNKTKYSVGEEIDLTGFKAVATYEDKSTKDVTNSVVLDSINMDKAGEKIVTLSYTENGRTVRGLFNISVEASSGGGCHGSIIASSAIISLTSLLGVGLLLIKKKNK